MALEEAERLQPGERVEALLAGGWAEVEVVAVMTWLHLPGVTVHLRRLGKTSNGARYPVTTRQHPAVRFKETQ